MQISIEELKQLISLISDDNKGSKPKGMIRNPGTCHMCNNAVPIEGSNFCFKCIEDRD